MGHTNDIQSCIKWYTGLYASYASRRIIHLHYAYIKIPKIIACYAWCHDLFSQPRIVVIPRPAQPVSDRPPHNSISLMSLSEEQSVIAISYSGHIIRSISCNASAWAGLNDLNRIAISSIRPSLRIGDLDSGSTQTKKAQTPTRKPLPFMT